MRLFLDANVLFTAAWSAAGVSRSLFALASSGACTLHTSAYAEEEARRNLGLKAPETLAELERLQTIVQLVSEPPPQLVQALHALPLPPKDAPIMAAAIACRVEVLVTGDRRDFGPFFGQTIQGVRVLSPREALEEVLAAVEKREEGE